MHKRYANPNKFSKHDRAKAKKFMPQRKPSGHEDEEDFNPDMMECTECGNPIPVAQINQHKGVCDECRAKAEEEDHKVLEDFEDRLADPLDLIHNMDPSETKEDEQMYDPADPNETKEE